ncbi:hypothetical protein M6B38_340530 [Iris pallida]|uniref:Uncharacterized protein n=1 Tax=Iris pallida TaxID=29817 RepID=A0AAX6GYD6_IRIPA|nr:hypothetical protein M6B38_340530 [Iris pallida]
MWTGIPVFMAWDLQVDYTLISNIYLVFVGF